MTESAPIRIAVLSFAHTHALSYVHALKSMPGDGWPKYATHSASLLNSLRVSVVIFADGRKYSCVIGVNHSVVAPSALPSRRRPSPVSAPRAG